MLPEWMMQEDDYFPAKGKNAFSVKSIKTLGNILSRIRIQKGHEKKRALPPLIKLFMMTGFILLISISQNKFIVMAYAAVILLYFCTWPAKDIAGILKTSITASLLTFILLIPAIIVNHSLLKNELFIVVKVFLSILTVSIFNHTTQWNHITGAMRKIHIPGIFVFTLDITLKYIVLLGNMILDMLTALQFRSVGKNNRKYTSVGGIMGVTFIRSTEMNRLMYEAMQCRGFTDDYKGL